MSADGEADCAPAACGAESESGDTPDAPSVVQVLRPNPTQSRADAHSGRDHGIAAERTRSPPVAALHRYRHAASRPNTPDQVLPLAVRAGSTIGIGMNKASPPASHHFNIRLDREMAAAVQRAAKAERLSLTAFAREALRARLDVGQMVEPLRLAMADASAMAAAHVRTSTDEGVRRVLDAGASERESVRALIAEFLASLQAAMGAPPTESASLATAKPIR